MKTIILTIFLGFISTGCATNVDEIFRKYPTQSTQTMTTVSPQVRTVQTPSGNYVVVPNYSTGQVQAIIGPNQGTAICLGCGR